MSLYLLPQEEVDEIKGEPCQKPWGVSKGLPRMKPKKSHLKGCSEVRIVPLSRKKAERLLEDHPFQHEILELLFTEPSVAADDALAPGSEAIVPFEDWMEPNTPVIPVEDSEFVLAAQNSVAWVM